MPRGYVRTKRRARQGQIVGKGGLEVNAVITDATFVGFQHKTRVKRYGYRDPQRKTPLAQSHKSRGV